MSRELKVRIDLDFRKGGVHIPKRFYKAITVTGETGEKTVQEIGTTVETITVPADAGTIGFLLIRNMDATNYLLIGTQVETLAYDTQTANFTVGLKVTGISSSATGWIVYDDDGGTSGTLVLSDVQGTFTAAETITDSSTGSAKATAASVAGGTAYSTKLKAGEAGIWRHTGKDVLRAIANTAAVSIEKVTVEE